MTGASLFALEVLANGGNHDGDVAQQKSELAWQMQGANAKTELNF